MKKNILAIVGSASKESSNLKLVEYVASLCTDYEVTIFNALQTLPHFDPALTDINTPNEVVAIRNMILDADGIIICTPEYIFSIPSGLKNLIEWCVSTTVFSQKPIGLITASAQGEKCHQELKLIMKTLETIFTEETTLLIQGVKGKIEAEGKIRDEDLKVDLEGFVKWFCESIDTHGFI